MILLHGLGRTSRSMRKLEHRLTNHGYRVVNLDYPSTKFPIEFIADEFLHKALMRSRIGSDSKIHFVTHSMGGIVVRYYLKHHELANLGRVVMLSPPNQGSELVDYFNKSSFFKKRNGPAGLQLGTDKDCLPLKLGPVDFELGVITGRHSLNPISSTILPGPDDGMVTVKRSKVKGMTDFLVVPVSHSFIMKNKKVIRQVIHFLQHGVFNHHQQKESSKNCP